ncbi:MAG TPA: thioesterase family protein [Solirubrobacteraceae bacterium]|nr:thioesterase family protein [Solirubrobacteraceae bacterium]
MSAIENIEVAPGRYRVALRWGDIDALGHVNQAVYHELLEEARTAMISRLPSHEKHSFVMARVELDYRREIPLYHRFVDVTLHIETVGRASITVAQQIYRSDGELAADGRSVLVAWDAVRRGSRPLSEQELAALQALQTAVQPQ